LHKTYLLLAGKQTVRWYQYACLKPRRPGCDFLDDLCQQWPN